MNSKTTIRIPITAKFAEINGEMVMVDAEYRDIDPYVIAKLIVGHFGKPWEKQAEEARPNVS